MSYPASRFVNLPRAANSFARALPVVAFLVLATIAIYGQTISKVGDGRRFYPDDPLGATPTP